MKGEESRDSLYGVMLARYIRGGDNCFGGLCGLGGGGGSVGHTTQWRGGIR